MPCHYEHAMPTNQAQRSSLTSPARCSHKAEGHPVPLLQPLRALCAGATELHECLSPATMSLEISMLSPQTMVECRCQKRSAEGSTV